MSPGPNTIRKVSRFRVHLDFTTRPRTGAISVSKLAAGSITNLLFIDTPPLPPVWGHTMGTMADGTIAGPQAEKNTGWRCRKGGVSSSRNRSVGFQPFVFTTATSVEDAAVKAIS